MGGLKVKQSTWLLLVPYVSCTYAKSLLPKISLPSAPLAIFGQIWLHGCLPDEREREKKGNLTALNLINLHLCCDGLFDKFLCCRCYIIENENMKKNSLSAPVWQHSSAPDKECTWRGFVCNHSIQPNASEAHILSLTGKCCWVEETAAHRLSATLEPSLGQSRFSGVSLCICQRWLRRVHLHCSFCPVRSDRYGTQ